MKFLYILILSNFLLLTLHAQDERDQQPSNVPGIKINSNRLYGKLIDKKSGKPIEAASVQVLLADSDSVVTGMLSRPNGDFSFQDIGAGQHIKIVISAIGYAPVEQIIEANEAGMTDKLNKDLGNIELEMEAQVLSGVTVVSNKPVLELGIDRKVYNVAKSLTATGGTAIDVMKNIPSVKVDIDGNVQLRNTQPQIFIDGRPTILTLDQIPADNIEKIELVTNPSAKYDAASSGGIINIVLKKNKRVGLNGIISASVGTPKILNSNLNLNLRQGKFNFFVSGGYNQSGGKAKGETMRQNKANGVITDYFNQLSENDRFRRFRSIRFGVDYFIDNRNTLSVTQDFGNGRFRSEEKQRQEYLNSAQVMEYFGDRLGNGRSLFKRNSTRASYKHSFPQEGRELTADITYNQGRSTENSTIVNSFLLPGGGGEYKPTSRVRNEGEGNNDQFTFQADYVHPVTEKLKWEIGARSFHNESKSYFNAFAIENALETKLPLSNNYKYTEMINALYATLSVKKESFSYQVGLRAEHSKFTGMLIDSAYKFGYEYPSGFKNIGNVLFPSLFLTKQIGERDQLQLNYSRRIRRPDFWQINPFININDPVNLRQGNPQLRPEFINSFEFNYSRDYKNGNFLASLYFRNNPDDITQYSDTITADQYDKLQNAGVDPNAILNTFINASTTNRYGAEFVLQHKVGDHFNLVPSFNLQYRTVKANINDLDLSNEGFNWEVELMADYKIVTKAKSIFNNLGFQLTGEYESAEVIPQGKRKPEYSMDFAMRKDFLKNKKATITFGINDVFNTQRWGTIYDTETFYQDSYRRWNVRNFRITLSYKFGKADFTLSRRNDRQGGDDD